MEGLYDAGNRSAVFRSAEAMGLLHTHVLYPEIATKPLARAVSRGAEKWMLRHDWDDTRRAATELKTMGYRLYAADLDTDFELHELDFSGPVALVFGNERFGISDEMRGLADARFKIPMFGMVESLNISVAAGIALHHARKARDQATGKIGDLTDDEITRLYAAYLVKSAPAQLRRSGEWDNLDYEWMASILP